MTKKKMMLVAAILLLLPCMAFATKVTYSTSGSVTGASFITYHGVASKTVNSTPAVNEPFGILHIHCTSTCATPFPLGGTLAITVTQSLPGVGTGSTSAILFATFTKTAGGFLVLGWSGPATISAGGFETIYTPITSFVTCTHGTCNIKLLVDISQVPLVVSPEPDAQLLLGLGTFGLMGLATVSRKLISV